MSKIAPSAMTPKTAGASGQPKALKHKPVPYQFLRDGAFCDIRDANGALVASDVDRRTGAFIVKAVNCHADLLFLLGCLEIELVQGGSDLMERRTGLIADIRAAIAKATDSAATRTSSEASTSISNPSNTGVKDE